MSDLRSATVKKPSAANGEQRLARTFVTLVDAMVTDFDLIDLLHLLAESSVNLLSVDAAALMLSDQRGNLRVLASTSEETRVLELFEIQSAEGPSLDCVQSGEQVVNIDVDEEQDRWPLFTAEAAAAGFSSVHALPLHLRGTVVGAINLFCVDQRTLSANEVAVGQALADVATIGLLAHFTGSEDQVIAEHLQAAVNSRIVIEQAKGFLAERLSIDMNKGLVLLRAHARTQDTKLTAIAAGIIDGSIPVESLQLTDPSTVALQAEVADG